MGAGLSVLLQLQADQSANRAAAAAAERLGSRMSRTLSWGGREECNGHSLITWMGSDSVYMSTCVSQEKGQSLVTRW